MPDPLAALLALKRQSYRPPYEPGPDEGNDGTDEYGYSLSPNVMESAPELARPLDTRRNPAKTGALRRALGMAGPDVGDISQQQYEQAYGDIVRPQQEQMLQEKVLPAAITAQGAVQAARERAQGDERMQLQLQRQGFQSGQNQLQREAADERSRAAREEGMIQAFNPTTGQMNWVRRGGAEGLRAGVSAGERQEMTGAQNTIDSIKGLLKMGDTIGWKGVGLMGSPKNKLYKFFGYGDPNEDRFRQEVQRVWSDIAFGAGGKQLTEAEARIAAGYLADINTNPAAAQTRLQETLNMLERAQAKRVGGLQATPTDQWEDVR